MRYRMTILSLMSTFALAGVGLNTAHAICLPDDTECPPPRPPPKRTCSDPAPAVADLFTVQCRAADGSRCANTIDTNLCHELNEEAHGEGVINDEAFNWLQSTGKCAIAYVDGMGYHLEGVCRPGCFAEDTEILTSIEAGLAPGTPAGRVTSATQLMSLADKASPQRVNLIPRTIDVPTHGPEEPDLFVFTLSNGKRLRVTNAHPMVLTDGSVIRANRVQPHAMFAGSDGRPVAVLAITRESAKGDVFGFETKSDTRMGHIIVAEGVLVGDLRIQDELQAELTSLEARR
jgi:hypothetical protein